MAINEIKLNGETLLTTRGDTVSPETLAQGETATNRAGEKIIGKMDGEVSDAYKITDPVGTISDEDYIPFNDVSDSVSPKKKTLFSAFVEKLKGFFLKSKGGKFGLDTNTDTIDYTSTDIDASRGDNNVSSIRYPSVSNILDRMKRIIMRTEAVVNPNGKIGWKAYVRNYDTDGNEVGQKGMQFHMDKSGNLEYTIDDFNAFRAAIQTIDQLGTTIPADSDLNDYMTAGTYRVPDDTTAADIENLPLALCGKVVVLDNGNGGLEQVYFPNHEPRILIRSYWNSSWGDWKELELKTAGAIYALIDGSNISDPNLFRKNIKTIDQTGTEIPANADLNTYVTYGTYQCVSDANARTMSNLPYTGDNRQAFKLIVMALRNSTNVMQIYIPYLNVNHSFALNIAYRTSDNNGTSWNNWTHFANADSVHYLSQPDLAHQITANQNLNDFTTEGTYQCNNSNIATTLSNCPVSCSFKLIVDKAYIWDASELTQRITCQNLAGSTDWYRTKQYNASTWGAWKHLASTDDIQASAGSYYGTGSISGSAITANITGFTLATGRIVVIRLSNGIPENATLNISSTGAKDIYYWGDNKVRAKDLIYAGAHYTFIYDGARYRLISIGLTPTLYQRDYVADTSGYFGEVIGYGSNVYRIEEDLSKGRLRWNYFKNNAWRGDVELAEFPDLYKYGQYLMDVMNITDRKILYTDDLNDFIESGTYQYSYNTNGLPANCPFTNIHSFKLIVDRYSSDSRSEVLQRITMQNTGGSTTSNPVLMDWYRTRSWNCTVWSAWKQVASMDDISSATGNYLPLAGGKMIGNIQLGYAPRSYGAIAAGAYFPNVQDTIPNIINELRYSNGAWGSFALGTAYTLNYTTIPTGWYNYFYIPHRVGGEKWSAPTSWDADNVNYGTLMLFGMNNTNGMFRIRLSGNNIHEVEDLQKGNIYVGTCTTAASERAKEATVDGNFVLRKGVRIAIKSTNTNSYNSQPANPITLNVNGTGAKEIWYASAATGSSSGAPTGTANWIFGQAGRYIYYIYDGTYWVWDGHGVDNNTDIRPSAYCDTAAATAAKWASCTNYKLLNNSYVHVLMINSNTSASALTLNINNQGAKPIYINGAASSASNYNLPAGTYIAYYNGTNYYFRTDGVAMSRNSIHFIDQDAYLFFNSAYVSGTSGVYGLNIAPNTDKKDRSQVKVNHLGQPLWNYCINGTWKGDGLIFNKWFPNIAYCISSTEAATAAKVATTQGGGKLVLLFAGLVVCVVHSVNNTASNCTLNVDGTGAKQIYYNQGVYTGATDWICGRQNMAIYYMYDGTYWRWMGFGRNDNSTNFLPISGGTLTGSVAIKNSNVDAQASNNGLTSNSYSEYKVLDKNSLIIADFHSTSEPSGKTGLFMQARNYNGSTTAVAMKSFGIMMDKSGNLTYYFNDVKNANAALGTGYGTCATAAATVAKVATLANYVLSANGYVTIKFDNDVPANATLNINNAGAKNIYYRGVAITAGLIRGGDRATFIYNGSQYDLIGIDRDDVAGELTQTLAANATSVTFTGLPTSGNVIYDVYTSKAGLNYTDMDDSTSGQLKISFEAQSAAVTVYLRYHWIS